MVPVSEGRFDLDDYIDYLISILHLLGGDTHIIAVCQPSVPVLAAVARMEAENDPYVPHSMVLMGGPIDTAQNPTAVNKVAETRGIDWFRATSSPRCRSRTRASCAMSIRASCNCTAS